MVDLDREFSIGTLNVCDLAIRVRYRRCTDDTFRTTEEVSCWSAVYVGGLRRLVLLPWET